MSTVPDPPTIITIVPGNSQLTVTFSTPFNNGGSPITNYFYSRNGGSTKVSIGSSVSPFTVTGLINGTTYNITMYANNANGQSVASNSVSGTPSTVPNRPTISTVVPASSQLTVTFIKPSTTGGSPITNYLYSIDGGSTKVSVGPTVTPFTITGLTNGTTYSITMYANNVNGISVASIAVSGTPVATVPGPPIINTLVPGNLQLTVNFTPINNSGSLIPITSYYYTLNGGSQILASQTSTPIVITGLTNGTGYNVRIYAVNSTGESSASNSVSGIPNINPYLIQTTDLSGSGLVRSVCTDGSAVWTLDTSGNINQFSATTGDSVNFFPATPGNYVNPVMIFSDGSYVWACDSGAGAKPDGFVNQYNTSGTLLHTIDDSNIIQKPTAIYSNGTYAWIANYQAIYGTFCVTKINTSDGTLQQTISGASYNFDTIVNIASDGTNIFTINYNQTITQFSAATGDFIQNITSSTVPFTGITDIVSNGIFGWITSRSTIYKFELSNPSNFTAIPVSLAPLSLTIDLSSVWVNSMNTEINSYFKIDISTNSVDSLFSISNHMNENDFYHINSISTPQNPNLGIPNHFVWGVQNNILVQFAKSVPDPPVINSVAPGNSQLTVTFSAPTNDGGTPITDYSYSIDGGSTKVNLGLTATSFTITGLTNGTNCNPTKYTNWHVYDQPNR